MHDPARPVAPAASGPAGRGPGRRGQVPARRATLSERAELRKSGGPASSTSVSSTQVREADLLPLGSCAATGPGQPRQDTASSEPDGSCSSKPRPPLSSGSRARCWALTAHPLQSGFLFFLYLAGRPLRYVLPTPLWEVVPECRAESFHVPRVSSGLTMSKGLGQISPGGPGSRRREVSPLVTPPGWSRPWSQANTEVQCQHQHELTLHTPTPQGRVPLD